MESKSGSGNVWNKDSDQQKRKQNQRGSPAKVLAA
jgi:hypothetical protein